MSRFQILSLDGGGIRGAFAIGLLAELEREMGRPVSDFFDLIAGTSTGAITAANLATGISAQHIAHFYEEHAETIFQPRKPYRPRRWMRFVYPTARTVIQRLTGHLLDGFFRARYCPEALESALAAALGDRRLSDLDRTRFIVPAVNLSQGRTAVFRTPHLPMNEVSPDFRVVDVLLAATAAPTYFPHKQLPDGDAYCDGGLWAASPAVLAVAEAMRIKQLCLGDHCDPHFDTSDVHLLSIGTGNTTYSLSPPGADAGTLFWSRHVADVMSVSQVQGAQAPMQFLLGDRFFPINFDLPDDTWSLDGISHMHELFEWGRRSARIHLDELTSRFCCHHASTYQGLQDATKFGLSSATAL